MSRFLAAVTLLAFATAIAGCVACPRVIDPGPERYKQGRAQRFDPFPENDIGPAVTGGRPGEFRSSPPEVLRVQPRRDSPLPYPTPPPSWP